MSKIGSNQHTLEDRPWTDENLMRNFAAREFPHWKIAEELGTTQSTISNWFKKLDINHDMRSQSPQNKVNRSKFRTDYNGYERASAWNHEKRGNDDVYIHRLLAVSMIGIDSVKGKDVHHINGISWDNRPENIEVISKSEHGRIHGKWKPSESK